MDWRSQFEMFMPHGMCLLWRPWLMSLHIVSDGLIALAYFVIPFAILRFVQARDDLGRGHVGLAFLFGAFIALCGLTHLVSILVLWVPIYIIEGWLKAATALTSLATAGWLMAHLPEVIRLPSFKSMQSEMLVRRKIEDQLRASEYESRQSLALINTIIEVVPGLLYAKDRFGRITLANKCALELIGKPWSEVKGRRDDEFLSDPRQAEIVMAHDRHVIATGTSYEVDETVDHPVKGPRVYHSTKVPLSAANGAVEGLVGLSIDITGRKEVERDFLHVARRSAMGDMAAALAHEVNQPLAAVSMYLGGSIALLTEAGYEGSVTNSLSLAKDQCQRAGAIIRRVRSFVSGGNAPKRVENVSRLVDEACSLALLGSRDSGIAISIEHASRDVAVYVDEVQIAQVVVNLVRNAIEAVSNGKDMALRVTTGYGDNEMALVSVSDSGPGIDAQVVNRLFEPFVSTKGVRGMGVGLSICRTIVEGHSGKIWVEHNVEKGVTFHFTIPALRDALAAA